MNHRLEFCSSSIKKRAVDLYCLKDRLIWCQQGKETRRKQRALPFYVLDSEQVGECSLFVLSKNTAGRLKGTAGARQGCILHGVLQWGQVRAHPHPASTLPKCTVMGDSWKILVGTSPGIGFGHLTYCCWNSRSLLKDMTQK